MGIKRLEQSEQSDLTVEGRSQKSRLLGQKTKLGRPLTLKSYLPAQPELKGIIQATETKASLMNASPHNA